ncbi:hypothetical protein [Alkaliflexus imshenetskii]|uniref:hypothetical protein n=1 Tax=Alkaliflexus imshenetskii TaxID=286730 RepID=UPI00047DB6AF|nr:hypothetical protein [Alkaliflexus imshenetskii]
MIKNLLIALLILAGFQLLGSCSGCSESKKSDKNALTLPDSLITDAPLKLSEEIMNEVIGNISSPVEMANLFKTSGVDFTQRILNNPDNVSRYETSFKRALNLGVFSADLGYINTFDKNNIVVSYLLAVKTLADGIRVGQFFDFNALRRMASSSTNLDSLMEMSVTSFNRMDSYLREQNRSNVSTLIVTGAWIEGLYIASSVVRESGNKDLSIRIAEQKDIINILEIILSNYAAEPNFADLVADIRELKEAYAPIRITRELGEPQRIEKDGVLIFIQDEISTVHYSEETLNNIMDIIEKIRTKIVA